MVQDLGGVKGKCAQICTLQEFYTGVLYSTVFASSKVKCDANYMFLMEWRVKVHKSVLYRSFTWVYCTLQCLQEARLTVKQIIWYKIWHWLGTPKMIHDGNTVSMNPPEEQQWRGIETTALLHSKVSPLVQTVDSPFHKLLHIVHCTVTDSSPPPGLSSLLG